MFGPQFNSHLGQEVQTRQVALALHAGLLAAAELGDQAGALGLGEVTRPAALEHAAGRQPLPRHAQRGRQLRLGLRPAGEQDVQDLHGARLQPGRPAVLGREPLVRQPSEVAAGPDAQLGGLGSHGPPLRCQHGSRVDRQLQPVAQPFHLAPRVGAVRELAGQFRGDRDVRQPSGVQFPDAGQQRIAVCQLGQPELGGLLLDRLDGSAEQRGNLAGRVGRVQTAEFRAGRVGPERAARYAEPGGAGASGGEGDPEGAGGGGSALRVDGAQRGVAVGGPEAAVHQSASMPANSVGVTVRNRVAAKSTWLWRMSQPTNRRP
jgi:hypothetical protein